MLRYLNLLFTVIVSFLTYASAEMISVKSISEVQAKVAETLKYTAPESLLVAFDIDMTLTQPIHPATYYPNLKEHYDILKGIMAPLTDEQKDVALTLTTQLPQRLVEAQTPSTIKALQSKGVKVIAFTASLSGSWKDSANKTIFKRKEKLFKMGFDFRKNGFPTVVTFMNFPKYADGYPMYYHGVLSSNGENSGGKGQTMVAFVNHIGLTKGGGYGSGYVPKVVIVVDDRIKNLEDIEESLKEHNPDIQFIGIEYQGAYGYAPEGITADNFKIFWQGLAEKAKSNK